MIPKTSDVGVVRRPLKPRRPQNQPSIAVGHRFNRLTVLEDGRRPNGPHSYQYRCRCDCGNEVFVKGAQLKSGNTKSCGCLSQDRKNAATLADFGSFKISLYRRYVKGAAVRGHVFELTREQAIPLFTQICHYCGSPPATAGTPSTFGYRKKYDVSKFYYNGIDRVDNSKGYTVSNVVPCCSTCNRSKGTMPLDKWLEWARRLSERFIK